MADGITRTGHPADDTARPPADRRRLKDDDDYPITPDARAEEAHSERTRKTAV